MRLGLGYSHYGVNFYIEDFHQKFREDFDNAIPNAVDNLFQINYYQMRFNISWYKKQQATLNPV